MCQAGEVSSRGFVRSRDSEGEELSCCCTELCSCPVGEPGTSQAANGAVWSQTAPKGAACMSLSPSPRPGPASPDPSGC